MSWFVPLASDQIISEIDPAFSVGDDVSFKVSARQVELCFAGLLPLLLDFPPWNASSLVLKRVMLAARSVF